MSIIIIKENKSWKSFNPTNLGSKHNDFHNRLKNTIHLNNRYSPPHPLFSFSIIHDTTLLHIRPFDASIKEEIVALYPVESILGLYPKNVRSGIKRIQRYMRPSDIYEYIRRKNPAFILKPNLSITDLIQVLLKESFFECSDQPEKTLPKIELMRPIRELVFMTRAFDPRAIDHLVQTYGDKDFEYKATRDALMTMLAHIPPEKQKRVLDRITMETKPRGFSTSHMYWWDIQPQWRILRFLLHRDEYSIPITLMWKMTNPAASSLFTPSRSWIPEKNNGNVGFGIEFHYEAYQHLRNSFIEWLSKPLELPFPLRQSA